MKLKFRGFPLMIMLVAGMLCTTMTFAQKKDNPWTKSELMQPAELAKKINSETAKAPLILNLGFVNDIKGAVHFGSINEAAHKKALEKYLQNIPKDTAIVIYCGCCPFTVCPNIRPAYKFMKAQGFTNFKVLDLEDNLKTDWVSKGYPMAKE